MIYYEHHLGDYLRDTAHLSVLEDGIYRRLLDQYYIRERPLPADIRECCKLARAVTRQERAAVTYVLDSFFALDADGYHQSRCDSEIARATDKRRKAQESANARWNGSRPQSEGNANAHANAHANALPTQCEGNALQSPIPNKNPPTPRKRGVAPAKSTIPETLTLDADLDAYVRRTIPDADPAALFEDFRTQAVAKGWTHANWRAAFQAYVRNCRLGSGHFAAGRYPRVGGGIQWQ